MLGCVCGRFLLFSWFSSAPRATLIDWTILAARDDAEELVLGADVEEEFEQRKAAQARAAEHEAAAREARARASAIGNDDEGPGDGEEAWGLDEPGSDVSGVAQLDESQRTGEGEHRAALMVDAVLKNLESGASSVCSGRSAGEEDAGLEAGEQSPLHGRRPSAAEDDQMSASELRTLYARDAGHSASPARTGLRQRRDVWSEDGAFLEWESDGRGQGEVEEDGEGSERGGRMEVAGTATEAVAEHDMGFGAREASARRDGGAAPQGGRRGGRGWGSGLALLRNSLAILREDLAEDLATARAKGARTLP